MGQLEVARDDEKGRAEAQARQSEVDKERASGPLSPVLICWRFSRQVWCVNNMRVCMGMGEAPPLLVGLEDDGRPELEGLNWRAERQQGDKIRVMTGPGRRQWPVQRVCDREAGSWLRRYLAAQDSFQGFV